MYIIMRKLKPVFLILLLTYGAALPFLYAQQNNTWYFGINAGLNFNAGNITIPYATRGSAMVSFEGSACHSDINGNIVLYTNSRTIYNKNHDPILNGSGLLGHESTYQSSLIVPMPNHDSIFYVFTADAYENEYENGYRYSIVNMNRNNGNGEVITKNILLYGPSSERLTGARHVNGIDVWIITNDNSTNTFRAYLLTCNGVQAPVISTTGLLMDQYASMNIGALKVSPDGRMLCQTHFRDINEVFLTNFAQLFSFDNATGIISNPKTIRVNGNGYNVAEFSPDSRLLYLTKPYSNSIDQFNVQLPTAAAIINSRYSIASPLGLYGIQAGPDNKIYVNKSLTQLCVINNPNMQGIGCDLEVNKIDLDGRSGGIGFPNVINDYPFDPYTNFSIQVVDSCEGIIQFNGFTNLRGNVTWEWDFGDGITSNLQNPVHDFADHVNLYYVKLTIRASNSCGYIERARAIPAAGLFAKANFEAVSVCDSGYVRFINNSYTYPQRLVEYFWDFGDGNTSTDANPSHVYNNSGLYQVKLVAITTTACVRDSITTSLNLEKLVINAVPDQSVINEGQDVQLDVSGGGDRFFWTPAAGLSNAYIRNPVATPLRDTTYIVTAQTNSGCIDSDTITIKVINLTDVYIPTAFTPNNDGRNEVFKPTIGLLFTLREFTIYNRWGQKLYSTKQRENGWNGKWNGDPQPAGVYVWTIKVLNADGALIERKGTLVLIR